MAFNNVQAFWLLLSIPVMLVLAGIFSWRARVRRDRFAVPELFTALARSTSKTRRFIRGVCFFFGLAFVIVALTQPRFGTKTEIVRRTGLDIVIAIDTSSSMLAEDVKPSRIDQAKYEIQRLIDNLQGDRVALLAFAGKSFVQCPLTTDYPAAKTLLETIASGIIPVPGTDIGEALEGSMELLERGSSAGSESQLIILFTDGENLAGDPLDVAEQAARKNIRIFTIGIGTANGEIIPIRNDRGQLEDYKRDKEGNVVKTALDEKTLGEIADATNGSYLRTVNGEVDIQAVIDELGAMQKSDIHERKISRLKERYQIPLGAGIFFLLTMLLVGERRKSSGVERVRITGTES